jgi:hypothetical protein
VKLSESLQRANLEVGHHDVLSNRIHAVGPPATPMDASLGCGLGA